MEKDECPFCDMEKFQGERILERHEHLVVFLSDPYLVPGHVIIAPKRHISSFEQLSREEWEEIRPVASLWIAKAKTLCATVFGKVAGCDLTQHDRPFLKRNFISVPEHLHFHVRPRTSEDELYLQVQCHETPLFRSQRLSTQDIAYYKAMYGVE